VSGSAKNTRCTLIPGLQYRDPAAAIEWLCHVFGFEAKAVAKSPEGEIMHAELSFGNGMVMLGPVNEGEFGRLLKQPGEIGGFETQAPYLVVDDADAVYERVKANGGEIAVEIEEKPYGGRGFTCRDPEEHLWSVGTYDPCAR